MLRMYDDVTRATLVGERHPIVKKFLGLPLDQATIKTNDTFDLPACDSWANTPLYTKRLWIDFEFTYKIDSQDTDKIIGLMKWSDAAKDGVVLSKLGPSVLCANCGFMRRPGGRVCHRCGQVDTTLVTKSRFERMGKIVSKDLHSEKSWAYSTTVTYVTLSFRSYTPFYFTFDDEDWQTTHMLDRLCEYCGSANDDKETDCQRCGSGRLPFSDFEKMESHCLYCGETIIGKLVCPACADARSALRYWPPRC